MIHNLGFMPSTAAEPSAYFLLAPPTFEPFPVHLKYRSSDFIRINLVQGGTYDFTCAQVTEILDLKSVKTFKKAFTGKATSFPYYMLISQTEWLSDTAVGPLPSTIERIGSYTPLVTTNFNNMLSVNDNNVQAAFDDIDNHSRRKLLTGLTYYVATTGDDANDGKSAASPFLTIQHAIDVINLLDTSTFNIIIQIADGTYLSNTITLRNIFGSGTVTIQGNSGAPANVVIDGGFSKLNTGTTFILKDFLVEKVSSSCTAAITAEYGAVIQFSNLIFGAGLSIHIFACYLGTIAAIGNYQISGGATYHVACVNFGFIDTHNRIITLNGTPAFSVFAYVNTQSLCLLYSMTFVGSATGSRFTVNLNSVINVGAGSLTYLPGNSAGTLDLGGMYGNIHAVSTGSGYLGFYGVTQVARPPAYTQTYSTASRTVPNNTASNPPAGGTGATAGAYDTAAHRDAMITSLTNAIADITALKQVVNSLIDDLQANGLLQ